MTAALSDARPSPRRGLSRDEAAAYLKITTDELMLALAEGRVRRPKCIDGQEIWDLFVLRMRDVGYFRQGQVYGVYVISMANFIKIGFSDDVNSRILIITQSVPVEPTIIKIFRGASRRHEKYLLDLFVKHRTRGEWFRNEGQLSAWITDGCPYNASRYYDPIA